VRAPKPYTAVANSEHRPASHRAHLDWPPSRMTQWARTVGPHTAEMVEKILQAYPHPEMAIGRVSASFAWGSAILRRA